MIRLIKKYIKMKLEAKIALKKEIARIDKVVQTLAIAQAEQNILIEEFKKQSFKEKFRAEHKKVKELEKKLKEIEKYV